ncbi:hypothetical protein ACVT98_27150 (plasmid) [Vibrio campbellii]
MVSIFDPSQANVGFAVRRGQHKDPTNAGSRAFTYLNSIVVRWPIYRLAVDHGPSIATKTGGQYPYPQLSHAPFSLLADVDLMLFSSLLPVIARFFQRVPNTESILRDLIYFTKNRKKPLIERLLSGYLHS